MIILKIIFFNQLFIIFFRKIYIILEMTIDNIIKKISKIFDSSSNFILKYIKIGKWNRYQSVRYISKIIIKLF